MRNMGRSVAAIVCPLVLMAADAAHGDGMSPGQGGSHGRVPLAAVLGMAFFVSELILNLTRRSDSSATPKDRHSLKLIWLVVMAGFGLGVVVAYRVPSLRMPWGAIAAEAGCVLLAVGVAFRWYAILVLGRFFTVNVAIAGTHRLVDTGPYRFIRHPSYTGTLMAILGLSLTYQNWGSVLVIFVPACAAILWRIHVEEQALSSALGQSYADYMQRTKRLIPGIY
jgi:protein-S-isoprenylcysteine O-methyltransferase